MISDRVLELSARGLCCSQILMQIVGLDARDSENAELITAMGALGYGVKRQLACGALTGAACALALHAADKQQADEICGRLVDWFSDTYGSADCAGILGKGSPATMECSEIMENTAAKCMEILDDTGL